MKSEICVSTKSLALDGTSPAQGDEVDVNLSARVTRTEGDKTYLEPIAANGEPIADQAPETPDGDSDDMSEAEIRDRAAKADNEVM